MKYILLTVGALLVGSTFAAGQDVIIEKKKVEERPGITIPLPVPQIGGERVEERRRIETEGRGGCDTKTVERETPAGEEKRTVKRCD